MIERGKNNFSKNSAFFSVTSQLYNYFKLLIELQLLMSDMDFFLVFIYLFIFSLKNRQLFIWLMHSVKNTNHV